LNILFLGDIIGNPGRKAIQSLMPKTIKKHSIDLVIANGENAAGGFGITENIADELFYLGIDVITSGNHIFDKKEILSYLKENNRLLRPANYPDAVPGTGVVVLNTKNIKVAIINISGLVFMDPLLCPFNTVKNELGRLDEDVKIKIIDFHAEVTSEKICMGWYLDGLVSAVVGTHTHIPTADERVLPKGTGYITDIGMTGPYDSVIGVKKDIALKKFLTRMPIRFDTAKGDIRLCGVVLNIDDETAKCTEIKRVNVPMEF
jgi:metallophosphoesterase (TIGR00282 family)